MGLTKCWWACDLKRDFGVRSNADKRNVVLQIGNDWLYKGFSVERIVEFLFHLQRFAKSTPVTAEKLPFWES